jgi:uncharacterized protein (TIGR00369 family)
VERPRTHRHADRWRIARVTPPTHEVNLIQAMRTEHHADCFVCSPTRRAGLGVRYESLADGVTQAIVACPAEWQGYGGVVHGGVIASLLDGAMTNCLFAHGIAAVTADLHIRYRHPVKLNHAAQISARITRRSPPLYVLQATAGQGGRVCVVATGKFMDQHARNKGNSP